MSKITGSKCPILVSDQAERKTEVDQSFELLIFITSAVIVLDVQLLT